MNIAEATRVCLRKYADFSGRARRPEFWWFVLVLSIATAVADLTDLISGAISWDDYSSGSFTIGPTGIAFYLATFVPGLSVGARRLHDVDRSGWWQLLVLVPVIGWGVLIFWFAKAGNKGENRYGPAPL
jgi:uncharacterized membrane protein YhaH (DUF805 family)